jgi:hypothetical protein
MTAAAKPTGLKPRELETADALARIPHTRVSLAREQDQLAKTLEETADTYRSDPHLHGYWMHAAEGARMIARILRGDPR